MIVIEIPEIPVAWAAARIVPGRMAFNPRIIEKETGRHHIRRQYCGPILEGPIHLELRFEMPIPSSLSEKKKKLLKGSWHIKKCDLSNLQKFHEDLLKGIVIKDDSQVCRVVSEKVYSENPKTIIHIFKL